MPRMALAPYGNGIINGIYIDVDLYCLYVHLYVYLYVYGCMAFRCS
jgi:hypothetical protein